MGLLLSLRAGMNAMKYPSRAPSKGVETNYPKPVILKNEAGKQHFSPDFSLSMSSFDKLSMNLRLNTILIPKHLRLNLNIHFLGWIILSIADRNLLSRTLRNFAESNGGR